MKLEIYKKSGKKSTKKVDLEAAVFGLEPNEHSIYLAVNSEMAAIRQGTHSSKTKGEVQGTGAKPWRQKGTGRARVGYLRNPSRVHGSKAFGPKSHKYEKKINKKVKVLARKSILSQKLSSNNFMVIEEISLESSKTKEFLAILKNLNITCVNEARSILVHTLEKPITPMNYSESQSLKTVKSSISSENIEESTAH